MVTSPVFAPLPFEDGVGGDRGGVDHVADVGGSDAGLAQHRIEAVQDALRVVFGGRGDLAGEDRAVRAQRDDVGERAADIHAETEPLAHDGRPSPPPNSPHGGNTARSAGNAWATIRPSGSTNAEE